MALKLRIVSEQRRVLGQRQGIVFGVGGGSIGRAGDNDWVLPDPQRYLSSHHARVHFRHGLFLLEDLSTNGTFLNDSDEPIPKRTPCEINHGDIVRLGDYEMVVSIDPALEGSHERTADLSVDVSRNTAVERVVEQVVSVAPSMEGSLDVSLSPSALFAVDPASSEGLAVGNAYGQAVVVPFGAGRKAAAVATPAADNSDIIAARRMQRLQHAAGVTLPELNAGLEAFCRGAGLTPQSLVEGSAIPVLQLAGQLLREAVLGLKELEMRHEDARLQLRLTDSGDDTGERAPAFDLGIGVEDLLVNLLNSHNSRRLNAALWLRESFDRITQHQEAMPEAMETALREFLAQLEPAHLEKRFEQSASRNLMGRRPTNWDLYGELYRSLVELPEGSGLPHVFTESFAAAYQVLTQPADEQA